MTCACCGKAIQARANKRFCSQRCRDLARGRRKYGPHGYVITCEVCGKRKAVPITWKGGDGGAKACLVCAKERQRRRTTAWRAANPDKVRETERRRGCTERRRTYHRELARWQRWQPRLRQAAAEVGRAPLPALPPPPVPLLLLPPPSPRAPAQPLRRPSPRMFVAGQCANCGRSFVIEPGVPNAKPGTRYCSPLCGKQLYRRRRRALLVGPIDRAAVFLRDGGCCQLCGEPTNAEAPVPDDLAAVIDHVIPLARGGRDVMDNVQTAHFRCNSFKRDLTMAEFAELLQVP